MDVQKIAAALSVADTGFIDAASLANAATLYKNDSPANLQAANTAALTSIAVSMTNIGKLFAALVRDEFEDKT